MIIAVVVQGLKIQPGFQSGITSGADNVKSSGEGKEKSWGQGPASGNQQVGI